MQTIKHHIPIILLCSILLLGQKANAANKDPLSAQLNAGDNLMKSGKTIEALRIYYDLWQKDSRCTRCAYKIVEAYKKLNRLSEAGIVLQNIVATNPKETQAWLMLVDNYKYLNDVGGYKWAIQQSEMRFPNDKRIVELVKNMSVECDKMSEATHNRWSVVYQHLPAIKTNRTSTSEPAKDYSSEVFTAHTLIKGGNSKEAITVLKRCIARQPNSIDAYLELDFAYCCAGDLEAALATRKEISQKFPNHPKTKTFKDQIDYYSKDFPSIRAYERQGQATESADPRWSEDQMPLKVYICDRAKEQKPYSIDTPKPEIAPNQSFSAIVKECLNEWANASAKSVTFMIVGAPDSADIEIEWTEDQGKLHHSFSGGEAQYRVNDDGQVVRKVYVLTVGRQTNEPIGKDEFRSICLHEIGHVLGLAHSSNPKDVMYTQCHPKPLTSLSVNDTNRIRRLYFR